MHAEIRLGRRLPERLNWLSIAGLGLAGSGALPFGMGTSCHRDPAWHCHRQYRRCGAQVQLSQILENATGIPHTSVSNESGNYTFPDLPPGSYSVSAEAKGFKKEVRSAVDLVVNTSTRVDLTFTAGNYQRDSNRDGGPGNHAN